MSSDFNCNTCNKIFKNEQKLNIHLKILPCNVKPKKNHVCECKKVFASKQMLKYHNDTCLVKLKIEHDNKIKYICNNIDNINNIANANKEYFNKTMLKLQTNLIHIN
jgi:hypothetical protein